MGACTFDHQWTHTDDPVAAFQEAVADAQWEYGHGGYSGTLAEKGSYVIVEATPQPVEDAYALADRLIEAFDPRISDKWGPAGAIKLDPVGWLFFGWASN